jgi:predicted PurR-regulated permease PerM
MRKENLYWIIFGFLLFVLIGIVSLAFINILVTSLFVYYAARPIYRTLNAYTGKRRTSAIVSILVFIVPLTILVFYSIYIGVAEVLKILRTDAFSSYEPYMREIVVNEFELNSSKLNNMTTSEIINNDIGYGNIMDYINIISTPLLESIGVVGDTVFNLFMIFVIAYFLLKDDFKFRDWIDNNITHKIDYINEYLDSVDKELSSVFFGNILAGLIIAVMTFVIYTSLNIFILPESIQIPYPGLVAVLCGVSSLIPLIGMKIIYIPLVGYLIFSIIVLQNDISLLWAPVLVLGITSLLIDTIPELLIRPYISSRDTHLGALIGAYVFGPFFFGWHGLFLGPLILVLFTMFIKIVLPYMTSD